MAVPIPLARGLVTWVDDDDAPAVLSHKWSVRQNRRGGKWYAYRLVRVDGRRRTVYLHRVLTGAGPGEEVDHEDGDSLNNRRGNLRLCTRSQNASNRGPTRAAGRTSRFKGVSRYSKSQDRPWRAKIGFGRAYRWLGNYATEEEAARAYNAAALKYHGEFAKLNEVPDVQERSAGDERGAPVPRGGVPAADEGDERGPDAGGTGPGDGLPD